MLPQKILESGSPGNAIFCILTSNSVLSNDSKKLNIESSSNDVGLIGGTIHQLMGSIETSQLVHAIKKTHSFKYDISTYCQHFGHVTKTLSSLFYSLYNPEVGFSNPRQWIDLATKECQLDD